MNLPQYLDTFADHLANELKPILGIKGVTENSDLLGKYAEAAVRRLVHQMVQPMRVCTGAVLDFPIPVPLRQIDLIIWSPFPAPALFDVEGFGLVPKSSAFGVIEIKRTNYSGIEDKLHDFFSDVDAGKILTDWVTPNLDFPYGLGLVCLLDSRPSSRLQAFIEGKRAVAIFERDGDAIKLRTSDVLTLVNFLYRVTWRYRRQSSADACPQIRTDIK
jgi:hypothetical protein